MHMPTPEELQAYQQWKEIMERIPRKAKDMSWMFDNANKEHLILRIAHEDLQHTSTPISSTQGYEILCSYSWKHTAYPTIYAPGTPAKFTPPDLPIQLEADTGRHYRDQHAHRVPEQQFEPIFQALAVLNPDVRFNDVDVVINRSSLQSLFDFGQGKKKQEFHLDLNMIGTTLFVGRKVKNSMTSSPPGSYGRNFETEWTTEDPELEDAQGHHRVLQYDLGGLLVVVRIEVDAYVSDVLYDPAATIHLHPAHVHLPDTATPEMNHSSPQHTRVIPAGTLIPQSSLIELKSTKSPKPKEQVWFGRTSRWCLGRHKKGNFDSAPVTLISQEDYESWEREWQGALQKLAWFLGEVRRVVVEEGDGAAVLVLVNRDEPMCIYKAKEKIGALPREIVERFWGCVDEGSGGNDGLADEIDGLSLQ